MTIDRLKSRWYIAYQDYLVLMVGMVCIFGCSTQRPRAELPDRVSLTVRDQPASQIEVKGGMHYDGILRLSVINRSPAPVTWLQPNGLKDYHFRVHRADGSEAALTPLGQMFHDDDAPERMGFTELTLDPGQSAYAEERVWPYFELSRDEQVIVECTLLLQTDAGRQSIRCELRRVPAVDHRLSAPLPRVPSPPADIEIAGKIDQDGVLRLTMVNRSVNLITWLRPNDKVEYDLEVHDAEGRHVPMTANGRIARDTLQQQDRWWGGFAQVKLKPYGTESEELPLRPHFEIAEPSSVEVELTLQILTPHGMHSFRQRLR